MGLNINYICDWCVQKITVPEAALPAGWLGADIHEPSTRTFETGTFCSPECREKYLEVLPEAMEHASKKYAEEYYSFFNQKKSTRV